MNFVYEVAVFRAGRKENSAFFSNELKAKEIKKEVVERILKERQDLEIVDDQDTSTTLKFEGFVEESLNLVSTDLEYAKVVIIIHPLLD